MPLFTVYHQALILQLKTRTFHQTFQGFPNEVDWFGGGQFGQNGQKLHENDKIGIFGSTQGWGGGGGTLASQFLHEQTQEQDKDFF